MTLAGGEGELLVEAVNNHHHNKRPFASLRSRVVGGMTLLHHAAKLGLVPIMETLMEHRYGIEWSISGKTKWGNFSGVLRLLVVK